jgi:protein-disulfide isomerase
MKKNYICLLSFATLCLTNGAFAADAPPVQVGSQPSASTLPPAQVAEIEKVVASYLKKNPEIIMSSFQEGMEKQQQESVAKIEKAVAENKNKIFYDPVTPTIGNPQGTQSVVVFADPLCGYCKKFYKEIATLLNLNKDVKVIFKDIPIMGANSEVAIKAMLAAKQQGKYDEVQKIIYTSDKPLTKKQILKLAGTLGIDTKKLETDMESKAIKDEVDQTLALSKELGINGTPTLIIGETTVLPGYVSAEELNKKLKDSKSPAEAKAANDKAS